jgi:hypothetical protein
MYKNDSMKKENRTLGAIKGLYNQLGGWQRVAMGIRPPRV